MRRIKTYFKIKYPFTSASGFSILQFTKVGLAPRTLRCEAKAVGASVK